MQARVIRILRDVYVLDNTVNFMLNKRKSKKASGASPQTPLGELSALPQNPLAVTGGGAPPPVPSPSFEYIYQTPPPLSQNPGSAPVFALSLYFWPYTIGLLSILLALLSVDMVYCWPYPWVIQIRGKPGGG